MDGIVHAGEGNGTRLQYSCLENPMDGEAWQATVRGVTNSRTQLSDFTFTFPYTSLNFGVDFLLKISTISWLFDPTIIFIILLY